MLIRKPVAEVFDAFINPEITCKFWFTKSSGRLKVDTTILWQWEMYGVSAQVNVKDIEENKRILIEWGEGDTVEWLFVSRSDTETFVTITNSGFSGTRNQIVAKALDSMGGFTIVLCSLKAFLEHGIILNAVADKSPDAIIRS